LVNNQKAFAFIISEFLRHKEKTIKTQRYTFKGFDLSLVNAVSANLEKAYSCKIDVISLAENYDRAIKERASYDPVFIWISSSEASEYSSLSSTYKNLSNSFYTFRTKKKSVEGVYDLFDVTEWIFQGQFANLVKSFLTSADYLLKKKSIDNMTLVLQELWRMSERTPSLRGRLSASSIADTLLLIQTQKQIKFNDYAPLLGFEPSLCSIATEEEIRQYVESASRIAFLQRGTDADRRSKLTKFCENCLAGITVYYQNRMLNAAKVPNDINKMIGCFKDLDEQGRRVWTVGSGDVEIIDYSLNSGLPKKVAFKLRDRKSKNVQHFQPEWLNFQLGSELCEFLGFLKTEKILGEQYLEEPPLKLEINNDEIVLTFNTIEGYIFCKSNYRGVLDEV
jgi:hypothetical protein